MVARTAHVTQVGRFRVGWVEATSPSTDPDTLPVVLVHGLGTSTEWWTPTVPRLAARRRVLLVDLPGFGSSHRDPVRLDIAADILAGWLSAIGVDRADVVGHSMGGLVSADLAARRPELVNRLVLVDTAGLRIHRRVTRHLANVVLGGVRAPLAMYPVALRCALASGPLAIARAAHQILATDIGDRMARIAAPTLVVWGTRDELLPPAYGRRVAATIPGARFVDIDGAGHSPMWEQPAEFERVLLDFLQAPIDGRPPGAGPTAAPPAPPGASVTPSPVLASTGGRLVGRYLAVDDWSVHVRVGRPDAPAETPPIVFVHGFVASSRAHVPTLRRLARRHLVFAPDLPGFGWSSKPDVVLDVPGLGDALVAVMDAAGIAQAVLVGTSLGSQVAAQVAADHPDRVLAAVLTGPTFDPAEPSLAGQVLRLVADIPREHPAYWLERLPDCLLAGASRAIATIRHGWGHDLEQVLPDVRAPTVIVRGGHDPLVPRRWAREMAALTPIGRALEIGGAGHAVNHGAPDALTRIVEEVAASVAATGHPQADGLPPVGIPSQASTSA